MFDAAQIRAAVEVLRSSVARFEPGLFSGEDALELVRIFEAGARACETGRALSAGRIEETNAHVSSGHRDTSSLMASITGTSRNEAHAQLQLARRVASQPGVEEALRSGKVSAHQAVEISRAVELDPSAEKRLLKQATTETFATLKNDCTQVVLSVADKQAAAHKRRCFRSWNDDSGGFNFRGCLTADRGAELLAALKPHRDKIFATARSEKRRELSDAYDADAFMSLICSKGSERTGPKAMVSVVVDHAALIRGTTAKGERCEIAGVGAVSVATANRLLGDSILRVLVRKGVEIVTVSSPTRVIPAPVRAALKVRDRTCVVPGCDASKNLEIDHRKGFALTHNSELENLNLLCSWHHDKKTYGGWKLEGKPGKWKWLAPPGDAPPILHSG